MRRTTRKFNTLVVGEVDFPKLEHKSQNTQLAQMSAVRAATAAFDQLAQGRFWAVCVSDGRVTLLMHSLA